MSKIILNAVDFSTLSPGKGEFFLGVDIDGLPKLKRSSDTILLGASASNILEYYSVTYNQFVTLINTSGLQPGGVYLITDFRTRHYMQFTYTTPAAQDESVNSGSVERLLVVATSTNSYDHNVMSVDYPTDDIKWIHTADDRVLDHANDPAGVGKGVIYWRRSSLGNERDYDFRAVKFRRWNDGSGNYNIIRKDDAPVPGDYVDRYAFSDDYLLCNNNIVKSNITATSSGEYYMDNLVMATTSTITDNVINHSQEVHIDGTFTKNTINCIKETVFGTSSNVTSNDIALMTNCYIGSSFQVNQLGYVNYGTFSNNTFQNNVISFIDNSSFGTSSDNSMSRIVRSTIDQMAWNVGNNITDSVITVLERNNFNRIEDTTSTVIDRNNANFVFDNTVTYIRNNQVNEISGNTSSYITYNESLIISDNTTATISSNDVMYVQNNTNSGVIKSNSGLIISDNTSNLVNINRNEVSIIATNSATGSISFNIGNEISGNANDGDIDYNHVNLILNNYNHGDITSNVSNIISLNTCDRIIDNLVVEIGSNDRITGGKGITDNVAIRINSNVTDGITNNTVNQIVFNQVASIEQNTGYDFRLNVGTTSQISSNHINSCLSNTLEGNMANNTVNTVSNNTGKLLRNNGYIISSNIGTVSDNSVAFIQSNTSSNISYNIGVTVSGNTKMILGNNVQMVKNNTIEVLKNSGVSINDNQGPGSGTINNNNVTRISNNNITQITNNTGTEITNNTDDFKNGGIIDNNSVTIISSNSNFSNINYNSGDNISSNTFIARQYSGAIATFSYAGTGTPSIGDIATISYAINQQSVVCAAASIDGFINQIYGLFPDSGFTATYSGGIFTLAAPTSTTSYEGATFSVEVQGTYSRVENLTFYGTGLNDLSVNSSGYTASESIHYVVIISATSGAIADKYDWSDSKGNGETGITVSLTDYTLSYGTKIQFGSFTGHVHADNWDFDIVPKTSNFGPTWSSVFSGETVATFSDLSYNNVSFIYNNTNCQIKSNVGNTINDNTSISDIKKNNLNRIIDNSDFLELSNSSGVKLVRSTASNINVFSQNKNVDISDTDINGDIYNHTFLSSVEGVSMTPSNNMGFSTQSTNSRYLPGVGAHYEEVADITIGLTWSTKLT